VKKKTKKLTSGGNEKSVLSLYSVCVVVKRTQRKEKEENDAVKKREKKAF